MAKEFDVLHHDLKVKSLVSRIESKCRFNHETGCLEWTGRERANGGYGKISAGKDYMGLRVHRLIWCMANGDIPDHLVVMHSCDNPKCCNLKHLSLGTKWDNTQDMMKKGRNSPPPTHYGDNHPLRANPEFCSRGESNGNSSLTVEIVLYILKSKESLSKLANKFNVSKSTVSSIRNRKTWKHINFSEGE